MYMCYIILIKFVHFILVFESNQKQSVNDPKV